MVGVGGDSHAGTGGAFGAYVLGVGSTEMCGVVATGEIWIRVPETILIEWQGKFGAAVSAKDSMLYLCGQLGLDGGDYQAVEYTGSAIAALSMQERMTLSNMTAEIGGPVGLVAPDETTRTYLAAAGAKDIDITRWHTDADADILAHHRFNASELSPQVAAPGSPTHSKSVGEFAGERIDIAYIGACTGAKLDDLRMAAKVFKGRQAAKGVRLMVAPASKKDQKQAADEGVMDILIAAGAQVLPNTCGGVCWLRRISLCRKRSDHFVDGAQFQRPHGCGFGTGLSGLALYRGGVGDYGSHQQPHGGVLGTQDYLALGR